MTKFFGRHQKPDTEPDSQDPQPCERCQDRGITPCERCAELEASVAEFQELALYLTKFHWNLYRIEYGSGFEASKFFQPLHGLRCKISGISRHRFESLDGVLAELRKIDGEAYYKIEAGRPSALLPPELKI